MKSESKKPWGPFLFKAGVVVALVVAAVFGFQSTFRIGIDSQVSRCLDPYRIFLVNTSAKGVEPGDFAAFEAQGLTPIIPDGTMVVKLVSAVAGDLVEIRKDGGVFINGTHIRQGLPLTERLQTTPEEYVREFTVPEGQVFMTAWHPRSFDGRYWGTLASEKLIGKAYPLW